MRIGALHLAMSIGLLSALPVHALTLGGGPRANTLEMCFDEATISAFLGTSSSLEEVKRWTREALVDDSWGYYTNLQFTGWGDCAVNPGADIRITQAPNGGAYSSGDTIYLPFYNHDGPAFQRYHVQSAAVHEIGHQLNFPHDHLRVDSTYYVNDTINQKFRIEPVSGSWFTIKPDVNPNLCLTASTTGLAVTQEYCNGSAAQRFKWKDAFMGEWTRIENQHHAGHCLDIDNGETYSGAQLIHYPCHGGDNQYFKTLEYTYLNLSHSLYGLQVKHSNLWLDIPDSANTPGVQPIQYRAYFEDYVHLTVGYDPLSVMSYENGSRRSNGFLLSSGDITGARIAYGDSGRSPIKEHLVAKVSNKCFSYDGSTTAQQTCNSSSPQQQLRITYLEADYFRIFDLSSQKCFEENNNELSLATCSSEAQWAANDRQRFRMLDSEGAEWSRIQSKSSGNCLDVAWGNITDGADIVLWGCGSGDNQYFRVERDVADVNPSTLLQAEHSGKCIQSSAGLYMQQDCSPSDPLQFFQVQQLDGGFVRLVEPASNTCVTAPGTQDAPMVSEACSATQDSRQEFSQVPQAGGYSFENRFSGLCLDVEWAHTTDDALIIQWGCTASTNQIFSLVDE